RQRGQLQAGRAEAAILHVEAPDAWADSVERRTIGTRRGYAAAMTESSSPMRAPPAEPGIVSRLLARPDEVMLEHGAGGELLVAKLRVALSAPILVLPLIAGMGGATTAQTLGGLA